MASLSAADILSIWEVGVAQDSAHRALAILAAASPGATDGALAALPVGRRDARLFEIREETFGSSLDAVLSCPRCAERVEFKLDTADLRVRVGPGVEQAESELRLDEWSLRYRLPTGGDLAEAALCPDAGAARALLVERCILEARRGDTLVDVRDVPPEAIPRMAAAMAEEDPSAEVLLDFICPACGQAGQTLFDIVRYLWEELRAQAQRLLHEVHALARAYGWREADILALSAARRHAYLELAT